MCLPFCIFPLRVDIYSGVTICMRCFSGQTEEGSIRFSVREHGYGLGVSEDFVLGEFMSKDGSDLVLLHPALILLVQDVRNHFNEPVTINSGYRSPGHNRRVGGAANSRHTMGLAADIHVWRVAPSKVQDYVKGLDIGGIGSYNTFTHVDVEGENRRW